MRLSLIALAAFAIFVAVEPAIAEPKAPADPGLVASDTTLLQDEGKATAELQRRLRAEVTNRNGVLIIVDRSIANAGVTVMSATVMWGVDCGDNGIAVTFGAGSGDTDNGTVLQLTGASVTDDKCTHIAPAIGETVLAITKGN